MIRAILNKHGKQHLTKQFVYGYVRLKSYLSKTNKTCRTLLEKQGRTHKCRSSMDPYTWTCQCWTYPHQLCTDTGCSLEDHRERWMIRMDGMCVCVCVCVCVWDRQRKSRNFMLSVQLDKDIYIYIYIYIIH